MFPSKILCSFLLLSLSIANASPVSTSGNKVSLRFAAAVNATGVINIAEADRARAKAMLDGTFSKRDASVSVTNDVVSYTAQVGVGSPATEYTLIIDTGSSNTWVGAEKAYKPTSTSQDTGNRVSVKYGSGSFSGEEYTDTVSLGNGLTISKQSIGVASSATGFEHVDGILGVGPTDLTKGTVANTNTIPTVVDNLYSQGVISEAVLGVYFIPTSDSTSGELTFGGYDSSVTTSSVNYVPITGTSPASNYWGIDQSISYGSKTILSTTAGIVDTGTTLILIASDAFSAYQSVTGATLDSATGLLTISQSQYDNLQTLTFNIGSHAYALSPNAQIWPRSLNSIIGGNSGQIYLVIADIGSIVGTGLDFINGYSFLERYYSVFDTTNSRVGFATTEYTTSTSN
ncbi:aspartic peptidase domain-containing protein [Scleroderma yunnanense]